MATIRNKDGNITYGHCAAGCNYAVIPSESPEGDLLQSEALKTANLLDQNQFSKLSFDNTGNSNIYYCPIIDIFESGSYDNVLMQPLYCGTYEIGANGTYSKSFNLSSNTYCRVRIGMNGNLSDDKVYIDNFYLPKGTYYVKITISNFTVGTGGATCRIGNLQISKSDIAYHEYFGKIVHVKDILELRSNTDLNTLGALGNYGTGTNSIINSLINAPSGISGGEVRIEVVPTADGYVLQKFYWCHYGIVKEYVRGNGSDGWSNWNCYTPSQLELDTTTSVVITSAGLYSVLVKGVSGSNTFYLTSFIHVRDASSSMQNKMTTGTPVEASGGDIVQVVAFYDSNSSEYSIALNNDSSNIATYTIDSVMFIGV